MPGQVPPSEVLINWSETHQGRWDSFLSSQGDSDVITAALE